jgi:membrane associated rhomboid family serine protease
MKGCSSPAWDREDAFDLKPDCGPYGCQDEKGKIRSFETFEDLEKDLSQGRGKLAWIWVPEHERLLAPEEIVELASSLKKRRAIISKGDLDDAKKGGVLFGLALLWTFFSAIQQSGLEGLGKSQSFGLAVLLFVLFALRPGWEALKQKNELQKYTPENLALEVPEARFELWLGSQRARVSLSVLILMLVVGLTQVFSPGFGIESAGLLKLRYFQNGETWRLFTASFLHGNLIHFALNASALWYLARRVEILARWPHLAGVFLMSMLGAGWATVSFLPSQNSVGISGVVCGLLGFLLVFETLHQPLVPKLARRRVASILVSLVVIGALGFRFIDNASHFGGLLTGASYAGIVFPKSSSFHRPSILKQDKIIGLVSLLMIWLSGIGAIVLMMTHR